MILSIDVKPENILMNKNGRIVVKLDYYAQWANGAWLCTTEGETLEDFKKNDAKSGKNLCVGGNGGLSFG